ncbi:hypothetical protein BLNAU_9403 [Blattamonas nauphoetae]|uniref:Uncharacterized protein n=1 Tax=Blattamonas nauphoetae TaxID=2049346 RepID=A0ABQ9XVM9_9EUKA|nr:hypothetical protein BLNAU_9403 [Blattamonas nauphoetae]
MISEKPVPKKTMEWRARQVVGRHTELDHKHRESLLLFVVQHTKVGQIVEERNPPQNAITEEPIPMDMDNEIT